MSTIFNGYRLVEPAPRAAVLACAGVNARVRRLTYCQGVNFPTTAIYYRDTILAVAFFQVHCCKRLQFALAIRPEAKAHMIGLMRLAHSTLGVLAQSYCIFAVVHPAHEVGQRMARMIGFQRSRAGTRFWIYRRQENDAIIERW